MSKLPRTWWWILGPLLLVGGGLLAFRVKEMQVQRADDELISRNTGMSVPKLLDLERRSRLARKNELGAQDISLTNRDLSSQNDSVSSRAFSILIHWGRFKANNAEAIQMINDYLKTNPDTAGQDRAEFALAMLQAPGWREITERRRQRFQEAGDAVGVSQCDHLLKNPPPLKE